MALQEITLDNTFAEIYEDNLVVIGNPSVASEFQSHVRMGVFEGEDSISFCEEGVKGVPTVKDEIITLDLATRKESWFRDGRNLHWVEVLKEKPASNK